MRRFAFLVLLILIIISCRRAEKENDGKTVFRYNEPSGITSLDPAFSKDLANIQPCNMLYDGLVQLNDQLQPVPSIAKSWEISEDGRTYTFHLRNNVYFHDHPKFSNGKGRKVIASDFVYSFSRIADPGVASPGAWVFSKVMDNKGKLAFTSLNDSTLRIVLSERFPPFLGILCMKYCSVVPWEIVEHFGKDFRINPVGTGPFEFKMWKRIEN